MSNLIIGQGINLIGTLIREFNLKNIHVQKTKDNPYDAGVIQDGYIPADPTREALMKGMGGIPYLIDLTLVGQKYTDDTQNSVKLDANGNVVSTGGVQKTINDFTFEAVIATVDQASKIIKTEIQGRNGTVKEYIGLDDAKITFQGVIAGTNGVYPRDQVAALNDWCAAPVTKEVKSQWLNIVLGITNIVVTDWSFPQIAGGYSYQTFTIDCISDIPVQLIYT